MDWNEALEKIRHKVKKGMCIDPQSKFRFIIDGPDYACHSYNYNGTNGYKVKIGTKESINIPISMLKVIFEETLANNGVYNNGVFSKYFGLQKNHHPCHVHVVGKIFLVAGIVTQDNKRDYKMMN